MRRSALTAPGVPRRSAWARRGREAGRRRTGVPALLCRATALLALGYAALRLINGDAQDGAEAVASNDDELVVRRTERDRLTGTVVASADVTVDEARGELDGDAAAPMTAGDTASTPEGAEAVELATAAAAEDGEAATTKAWALPGEVAGQAADSRDAGQRNIGEELVRDSKSRSAAAKATARARVATIMQRAEEARLRNAERRRGGHGHEPHIDVSGGGDDLASLQSAFAMPSSALPTHDGPDEASVTPRRGVAEEPDDVEEDGSDPSYLPALVLLTYNRADYLEKTLVSLLKLPGLKRYALYVSQDGPNEAVEAVVAQFAVVLRKKMRKFARWEHSRAGTGAAHEHIARHYRFALESTFSAVASDIDESVRHSHAIVLEDDMQFAPDFLRYFERTRSLLDNDPTLWCISSWSDLGVAGFAADPRRLYRTSYFPGLGWMMRRELWYELRERWPTAHWDHFMRTSDVHRGRDCVVPEVPRNRNIGRVGSHVDAKTFDKYIGGMAFASDGVGRDVSYYAYAADGAEPSLDVLGEQSYERWLRELVSRAQEFRWQGMVRLPTSVHGAGTVRLLVYREEEYPSLARLFDVMDNPRGHHRHLAVLIRRGSSMGVSAVNEGPVFLLADARRCPFLPDRLRVTPRPDLLMLKAARGQSCTSLCEEAGSACAEDQFAFLNDCDVLKRHFPCERGCAYQLGGDIPNYVPDLSRDTGGQCLLNHGVASCGSRHPSTKRLCACAPA